ncbi:uncharacterized protein G2W53_026848 [Senna tora]|uniref:Uncharacterized protein n=1 Tax=Senna tora TaxID=362788 RepID=A0A834TG07_9FABA|nr:uncharacterized protein G2W53_026848 [Senna tora]
MAQRSVGLTCGTTHLNMYFLSSYENQLRFSKQNVFRHDLTNLPCDHEPHSSIKSTRIPKYNAETSFGLTYATKRSNFYFSGSLEIQSRFSVQNVFRHDLTHLPSDHEPHSSIKSTQIRKYNSNRSV